jgi:hypothetical protein
VDTPLAAAAVLTLLGLGVLHSLAGATVTPRVALADLPKHADRRVTVEARLLSVEAIKSGGNRLTLIDDQTSANAYLFAPTDLLAGDLVKVTARVQHYRGQWELAIDDPDDIVRLTKAGDQRVSLHVLASEPWKWRGQRLSTSGQWNSGELRDPATDAAMALTTTPSPKPEPEQGILLHATLVYEQDAHRFRLRPHSWTPWPAADG